LRLSSIHEAPLHIREDAAQRAPPVKDAASSGDTALLVASQKYINAHMPFCH
jgi:hypothetical protein